VNDRVSARERKDCTVASHEPIALPRDQGRQNLHIGRIAGHRDMHAFDVPPMVERAPSLPTNSSTSSALIRGPPGDLR